MPQLCCSTNAASAESSFACAVAPLCPQERLLNDLPLDQIDPLVGRIGHLGERFGCHQMLLHAHGHAPPLMPVIHKATGGIRKRRSVHPAAVLEMSADAPMTAGMHKDTCLQEPNGKARYLARTERVHR